MGGLAVCLDIINRNHGEMLGDACDGSGCIREDIPTMWTWRDVFSSLSYQSSSSIKKKIIIIP